MKILNNILRSKYVSQNLNHLKIFMRADQILLSKNKTKISRINLHEIFLENQGNEFLMHPYTRGIFTNQYINLINKNGKKKHITIFSKAVAIFKIEKKLTNSRRGRERGFSCKSRSTHKRLDPCTFRVLAQILISSYQIFIVRVDKNRIFSTNIAKLTEKDNYVLVD